MDVTPCLVPIGLIISARLKHFGSCGPMFSRPFASDTERKLTERDWENAMEHLNIRIFNQSKIHPVLYERNLGLKLLQ